MTADKQASVEVPKAYACHDCRLWAGSYGKRRPPCPKCTKPMGAATEEDVMAYSMADEIPETHPKNALGFPEPVGLNIGASYAAAKDLAGFFEAVKSLGKKWGRK